MSAEPIAASSQSTRIEDSIRDVHSRQRHSYLAEGPPSAEQRIDRLDRAIGLLVDHEMEIVEALAADFGHRSHDQSLLTDVGGSIEPLKFAKKHLRSWMKSRRRRAMFPLGLLGARAEIRYQPLGVVGLISPWNFPVNLTFGPLAGILAAGNRVMIKPSEFTPKTSALMGRMIASAFEQEERLPVCGRCEGIVKTATISFGQAMPEEEMMRAQEETLACDLFLVMGSSLVVYPAAGFPLAAKQNGANLVIINREPTDQDPVADLVVNAQIGETLGEAVGVD